MFSAILINSAPRSAALRLSYQRCLPAKRPKWNEHSENSTKPSFAHEKIDNVRADQARATALSLTEGTSEALGGWAHRDPDRLHRRRTSIRQFRTFTKCARAKIVVASI